MKNQHVFAVVSKVIKPLLKNQEEYFITLLENWTTVIPKTWQNKVYPIKFKWLANGKAILVLRSVNNAQTINLSFDNSLVINKLNAFFGHSIVTKIEFTHS